jgi:putative endopeptidase
MLLPLLLAASCATPGSEPANVASASRVAPRKGIEADDVNRHVDPCTDFYEYANGTWRARNPIPTGKGRWSRRGVAHDANRQNVRALVQELASKTDWPVGSPEQIVGDHYAACMDDATIESKGVSPIAPLLADIDAAKTPADVQRLVRRLHDLGIAAPFGETGAYDNHEPKDFLLNITAGGLGLPDRDAYLSPEPRLAALRDTYRQHVAHLFAVAGMPESAARVAAGGVIAFETRLAEASLDAKTAADPAAIEHKTTFVQLKEMAPHIEWDAYFDEAKIPRGPVNVTEPKFLQRVDHEFNTMPVDAWKLYLKWQLLNAASPWLSKAFSDATDVTPRAQRCVDLTETLLGEPVGRTYADKYFTAAAKSKAREIANGLTAALKENVSGLQWMTPDTKKTALQKLDLMSVQLGYPDTWKDLSSLHVHRDTLWANIAQARRFNVDDVRRQVGKPTNRNSWLLPPSSPDAYLDPQLNELVLPAGFLQPPYFDADATDAMNYGALGSGLAHDMTHTFDVTGALFDDMGRAHNWWTDADQKTFQARAQCIVDQYEEYEIEPGVHHQGKLVLNEALGDQAGVHMAYVALRKSMAAHPVPTIDGFTPEQQFFLAWAQFRGEAMRIETQRQIIKSDPHAVPKFRVIGPLSNLPEFAEAFSCKPPAPMVRPPEQRCAVW